MAAAAGECLQYPCDAEPCDNNAECVHLHSASDVSFQCLCQPGFSGKLRRSTRRRRKAEMLASVSRKLATLLPPVTLPDAERF